MVMRAHNRTGMRTGREQVQHALVRTAYFSAARDREYPMAGWPASVRRVGGSLYCVRWN